MTDTNTKTMDLHPLCTYFPRMSDSEFNALKDNLQDNGQTHPIYTLDGMILDGGNRYRALYELGIEPILIEYTGANPAQFILSSNLHRRHLSQGQSAAIVSASQSWINAQANSPLRDSAPLGTAAARAKQSGVTQRTQQLADKLISEAPAELVKEVLEGKKSLNKALKEISPPKPLKPKAEPVLVIDFESNQPDNSADNVEDQANPLAFAADEHILESVDRPLTVLEEIQTLTQQNKILNKRIIELMDEKQAAIQSAEYWKEQYLALESRLDAFENSSD